MPPTGEAASGPTPVDLETGEVLNGAWRLDEKIGQGGMGRVFKATDLKLGRKAAIKALLVTNLDDETVKRFEREAQVMGKLDHPGVVTLYGVGRTRGIPWLAMKHLEGRSLWGVLDENGGLLTPAVLLPIAKQLLTALGYIHTRGMLHRDLKPSNIHVGLQGKTTLLDLGLARGHRSNLTRTGVIWGTPDYMAPEQIVGERQLDGRADLYSVSCVLYRMLSGTSPFTEEDENELLRAHLTFPRPDISRQVPGLSPALGLALQKGLAIRPEDRFQTADEMLAVLEKAMVAPPREQATAATPVRKSGAGHTALPRRKTGDVPIAPDVTPKSQHPTVVVTDDDDDAAGARTQREGFQPLAATKPEGFQAPSSTLVDLDPVAEARPEPTEVPPPRRSGAVPTAPVESVTAPSEPVARPLPERSSAPTDPRGPAPLPAYLTPPYLIGGAILVLIIGVLLGKLL